MPVWGCLYLGEQGGAKRAEPGFPCILARSLMSASVKCKMSVCRGDFTSILIPSGFALQKRLAESTVNVCQPRLSNELDMVAHLEKKSQKIGCLHSGHETSLEGAELEHLRRRGSFKSYQLDK